MEVVIAVFITTVAVMAIFALVAPAWRTTSRSDNLGRAANILHDQLQTQESLITNPCNAVAVGATGPLNVFSSGSEAAQPGDTPFNVTRTITNIATNAWRITVRVTWPGSAGIVGTLEVNRQNDYSFPDGCTPL
jgi:Tfp pilus assembly protein PilV